ncbi:MAG: DUF309 domain-containing protein [Phototrophicaceae bacterium]
MTSITVALLGEENWGEGWGFPDGWAWVRYAEQGDWVGWLALLQPALIVIQDSPQALQWVNRTRTNNATRRMPILYVCPALPPTPIEGATATVTLADFLTDPPRFLMQYAHIPSSDFLAQLACECGEPLPPLAQQAIQQFNQREFYQQHDSLEALWVETPSPVRDLYRAILQVGIAYYQIERGNHKGALKMLWRSKQWLAILPDVCQGVDVARLRQDAQAVEDALLALSPHEMHLFDDRLLRAVVLIS